MSDANKPVDPKDQKRLEVRGQGLKKDYQPFIYVHEMSSSGESVRVKSSTVGRIHHLLSGIELTAFLAFDHCARTVDIREQFPISIEDSLDVCRQLGIRHPQMHGNLKVVTTDLLIDFEDNSQLAISVKSSSQFSHIRTTDKLQIEKAYWEGRGIKWHLFTELDGSDALRENLNWIRPYLDVETPIVHQLTESDIEDIMIRICKHTHDKVTRLCGKLDDQYQLEPGFHMTALRYSIAHHYIEAPLTEKPFHSWQCSDLKIIRMDSLEGVNHVI